MKTYIFLALLLCTTSFAQNNQSLGIKNYRALFSSMRVVTGVQPTGEMREAFIKLQTKLPEKGRIAEMTNQTLMAVTEMASIFCEPFAKRMNDQYANNQVMLEDLSQRFFSHSVTANQVSIFNNLFKNLGPSKNKVFVTCVTMLSSSEFIAQ